MPADQLAVLYSFLAAFFFGIMPIFSKRGLAYVDAQTGAMITIGTTALVYTLSAPFWMRAGYWFSAGFWVFCFNGIFHPTLSMLMSYEATRRTGPTVATTLAATTPLWAMGLAITLLNEHLTPSNLAGTLATISGVILISWRGRRVPPLMLGALLLATAAAWVRAVNQAAGKFGLNLLPVPIMAGWVSFTVSFCFSVTGYRLAKGRLPLRLPGRALAWCALGGVCISAAIFCMYSALRYGTVVVVTPIISANPVWTLLVALLFRQEPLTRRTVAGVLITVAGVVLVALK